MTDPIADMLTRIRNAQAVRKETVEVPFSAIKYAIAKTLGKKGFIKSAEFRGKKVKKTIEIKLKYQEKTPGITGARRVSKPGQRMYVSVQDIGRVKNGYGIAILSTSKGVMDGHQAQKEKVGGEILCEIW